MKIVHTFDDVRSVSAGSVGLVPTMGFLHEGHMSLIGAASHQDDTVVVSIFVNPMQFNETSDLDGYPRDLDRDAFLAEEAGADVLFAPDASHMYPSEQRATVTVAHVAESMEGVHRPGHFAGVATVVAKLLAGVRPDNAYFGRKDAQQLAVVTTMARELSFPTHIVGLTTVREPDGLALASRNVRLDPDRRQSALKVSEALFDAADAFEAGQRTTEALVGIALDRLALGKDLNVEYVEAARVEDATPIATIETESFLALAARVGGVRIIDNVHLDPDTGIADRGTRLTAPSILYGGS
jgi:pantoate--beta-alanine ligase